MALIVDEDVIRAARAVGQTIAFQTSTSLVEAATLKSLRLVASAHDSASLKAMCRKGASVGLVFAALWLTGCALGEEQTGAPDDPANVQSNGRAAAASVSCTAERLHEKIAELPAWLAANDEYVFWIETRTGVLFRQAKGSTEPVMLRGGVSAGWGGLAADTEAVYVGGLDGLVHRVPEDGSAGVVLSEIGGEWASQLQVRNGYVYWLSSSGSPGATGSVAARRVSASGGATSEELWSSGRASPGLAVQGDHLFVSEYTWPRSGTDPDANGVINRVSLSGAPTTTLASDLLFPMVHAADERFVYFSAQTHDAERLNQLWRVSTDGGVAQLLFEGAPNGVDVGQMVVEAGVAWWGQADDGEGVVRRMSGEFADAANVALVSDTQHMLGFAVDAEALYFSTSFSVDDIGPGVIWRVGRHCPSD